MCEEQPKPYKPFDTRREVHEGKVDGQHFDDCAGYGTIAITNLNGQPVRCVAVVLFKDKTSAPMAQVFHLRAELDEFIADLQKAAALMWPETVN